MVREKEFIEVYKIVDENKKYCYQEKQYVSKDKKAHGKYYVLDEHAFNGYLHALDIIGDRARQEVKESETDEHGYRLMRVKKREMQNHTASGKMYIITRRTPYNLETPLDLAEELILNDLKKYYNFIEKKDCNLKEVLEEIEKKENVEISIPLWNSRENYKLPTRDVLDKIEDGFKFKPNQEGYAWLLFGVKNNLLNNNKLAFAFDIDSISASNVGKGVYEVSYWATNVK